MFFLIKKITLSLCLLALFVSAQSASATDNFKKGYDNTAKGAGYTEVNSPKELPEYISLGIEVVLSIVGILFLGLMIYGGFVWMNAKGNEPEIKKAQEIIRNAIIGVVIVFAAYAITNIVAGTFDVGEADFQSSTDNN